MLKIIRTNIPDDYLLAWEETGWFIPDLNSPRVLEHITHALEINTPVILVGEFSKWSDFSKYIALACIHDVDIEIHTLHKCSVDETSVKHYVQRITDMFDVKVKYESTC